MKQAWMIATLTVMLVFLSTVPVFPDNYGAIAYDKNTGRWGYAYNYSSRGEAERVAVSRCGSSGCVAYNWFRNACGALAKASDGSIGWSWGTSRHDAEARAIAQCERSSNGLSCEIVCWACTDR